MPAHNELNGIPCHANKWLMTDIMRNEYGFDGFIVSDWMDMEAISTRHRISENTTDAFFLSVDGGVDMHMHGPVFFDAILKLIKEGKLTEERVNKACAKILEAKFRLGLFENRYVTEAGIKKTVFTKKHQQTALEIARRSIVLLKNESLLPVDTRKFKKILVTGPNANNQSIMGDWVFEQPEKNVSTILEGIKEEASGTQINYVVVGWNMRALDSAKIEEAIQTAKSSDLAIVIVGEDSFRQHWKEKTCGENRDRMDITLWGKQDYLVESIYKTGVPTIVILINGRPLATRWIAENIPAVIEAWEPGSMGRKAIAEILFGKVNPSGKLPITIPRHVGQISTVYNHKPSQFLHPYIDGDKTPLYPFGYGLSYTTFGYSDLKISKPVIGPQENITLSCTVKNTGKKAGDEVVQLYIRDDFSSVTTYDKVLRGFERIHLQPGEEQTVSFTLTPQDLGLWDKNNQFTVEPGSFSVMVGASSQDIRLKGSFEVQ